MSADPRAGQLAGPSDLVDVDAPLGGHRERGDEVRIGRTLVGAALERAGVGA